MKKNCKIMAVSDQAAPLTRRGSNKEIQGISPSGEAVKYTYESLEEEMRDVEYSTVDEEEKNYSHESIAEEFQDISPPDERVYYSYESLEEEMRDVEYSTVDEEEKNYSHESIAKELQDISPPDEGVDYTYESLEEEMRDVEYSTVDEEEKNYSHERITEELQGISPPGTEDINHKDKNDMIESRIDSKMMISDDKMCNYLMAKEIIWKYGLKRLSEMGDTIWRYNGRSYEPLDDQKLGELIYSEIPEAVKLEVSSCAGIKKNVAAFIHDELALAVKQGNRECYFRREDYKGIMGKVVLQNGVFDIQNGLLEEFDSTKPYYYELNAAYLEMHDDCLHTPAFDKLISDACGCDRESVQMILQVFGMLLTPNPCKKFPVVGPASNSGKSVLFGGLLEQILPRARISHIATSELKDKFALGNAENLLLITCMDVDMNTISAATAGVIKRATGEEVIAVQDKYKPRKDIEVRFKFVFGTNGVFCTQKHDKGWQNRILAVPFIRETPEEEMDMHLLDKLLEEKDAIVTKVLRAMETVITAEGDLRVKESELSIKLKYSWLNPNTCFGEFMSEMIEITGEEEDNYSTNELFKAYCQYYIRSVKLNRECRNNKRLSRDEFVSSALEYGRGLIENKRMKRSRKEHFKNSQHRLCGLLYKGADILDTDDTNELET